jgi:tetratricopeptide (TPR) repeat protein
MDQGWRLGAAWYAQVARLPLPELMSAPGVGCSWAVVRRDGEGVRCLLQLWEPRPPEKVLDTLREEFLNRFSQSEPLDPGPAHLGFDEGRLWFIQELAGAPLQRLWSQADRTGRQELQGFLREALGGSRVPRLLMPEVVGLGPGRVMAPRVLGPAPWGMDGLVAILESEAPVPGPGGGERPWLEAPDLADRSRLPLRGRGRELTYLKSMMIGLGAGIPMERLVILQGEEGLGHDRLCDWAAAAAETEGFQVANLEVYPGERPAGLLERLVQELIGGLEAELYAAHPAVARALSRRMATFGFLRGGRPADYQERKLEQEEIGAAVRAMAFARERKPRLVVIRGLERAAPGVPGLVRDLALASGLPWLLSSRDPGRGTELGSALAALRSSPASATVILDRLDDEHLAEVLEDQLGPHGLSAAMRAEIASASLGNPGLLLKILERAQLKGAILREGGRWAGAGAPLPAVELQEDLVADILVGRLHRLGPASLAAVRFLALAGEPLEPATLGRTLGLDPDAVEEALQAAANAKLVLLDEASARIQGDQVRELAIAGMPPREVPRCAQLLLKVLAEKGGKTLLAVRLQAFALDRETALAQVLRAIEHERTGPLEAERIVQEALHLRPVALQEASLWEFLADAWGRAKEGDGLTAEGPWDRSPWESALDALNRALQTLGAAEPGCAEEPCARLHRKKSLLEIRLRRLGQAAHSIRRASALLADHPFHPEQPGLRLAQARLHFAQGNQGAGLGALGEGLELLTQKGTQQGHQDQVSLMLELGRAQGQAGQFQGALATLDSLRRLSEHGGDRRMLAEALDALGQVRMAMGRMDAAWECLREALDLARSLDDVDLLAGCNLHLGMFWSCRQILGPAWSCLESSLVRYERMGDRAGATQAQAWQARCLAALGDRGLSELLLMRVAGAGNEGLTPLELGERVFLDAEIAEFRQDWAEARRLHQAAANRFEHAGQAWRERLARLRSLQAEARQPLAAGLTPAWIRLERLKGPVEGADSLWLETEWHRAHALLLGASGPGPAPAQTLLAWGQVVTGARELKFPALVLEACTRSAELLESLGERMGARSRIQDGLPSFQELGARLPESFVAAFQGRADIHAFRSAAEAAGLPVAGFERTNQPPEMEPVRVDRLGMSPGRDDPQ